MITYAQFWFKQVCSFIEQDIILTFSYQIVLKVIAAVVAIFDFWSTWKKS